MQVSCDQQVYADYHSCMPTRTFWKSRHSGMNTESGRAENACTAAQTPLTLTNLEVSLEDVNHFPDTTDSSLLMRLKASCGSQGRLFPGLCASAEINGPILWSLTPGFNCETTGHIQRTSGFNSWHLAVGPISLRVIHVRFSE